MPNDFFPQPSPAPPPSSSSASPFPLFQAPFDDAADYAGAATCSFCGKSHPHCFDLGIGAALILPCPKCKTENGLDADDRKNTPCRKCKTSIAFPKLPKPIRICHVCLRAGKAAFTHDTADGMISWDQVFGGDTEREAADIPQAQWLELLRTPTYLTLQEEQWQLCCQRPMSFLGTWSREDFNRHAPGKNGRALFDKIVQEPSDDLWNDEMGDETGIYVFRCPTCSRMTAHWDLA